tara:strand:+ start:303 stop:1280 length:978 start_codon:yes stop_codon:yes gene_type:complete
MLKIRFIDLFCGLGGFRIGMENNLAKCVFSSDNDEYVSKVYEQNFGENPFSDITEIDIKKIPDHEILCAGFPCQPFSIGGYRKGFDDTRGTLFFDILRILKEKKPKAIFLENVKGITNHDGGNTIKVIREKLKLAGYDIYENVLNAFDYGLPQNRDRWYCVGFKSEIDVKKFNFPKKTKLDFYLEDIIDKNVKDHRISEIALKHVKNNVKTFKNKKNSQLNLIKSRQKKFTVVTEARKTRASIRQNGISPCLTAKMGTGGNNVPILYELERKLTVKECLKLMGFPNDYILKENYSRSYKQIGNSVCVNIVEKIGKEIINNVIKYD